MSKKVMQMALDALETQIENIRKQEYVSPTHDQWMIQLKTPIKYIRAELAKSEPKPVAWMHPVHTSLIEPHKFDPDCIPLYRKEDL